MSLSHIISHINLLNVMMHLNNPFRTLMRAFAYLMTSREEQSHADIQKQESMRLTQSRMFFPLTLTSRTQCFHHEPRMRTNTA